MELGMSAVLFLVNVLQTGRVEFNNETFSLEVKNLQKNDSGTYRGQIISISEGDVLINYELSVLDPVEAPVMAVVSNWSSSDSCDVTVTCRGRDLSLTSSCNSSSCSPKEGASTDSTLTLSVRGGVVLCNYSNPVSWKHATLRIKPLCSSDAKTPSITIVVVIAIVFVASIAIYVYQQRSRGGETGTATGPTQTEYAEDTPPSSPGSPDPGASTYSTVHDTQPDTAEESPYDEICLQTLDVDTSSLDPLKNPSSNGGVVPQDPPQPDADLYATVRRT
ncbi:natural killer cell receptor 2B4-like isoform X2 [Alosa sapidissima]|uniref:natural killer cell receptor 2B4-like isoform X2 n=1 Tax=Alosa sapidissima TaxID=34773 RepID=UPI001C07FF71|nr:natural killer cell receptor 2B4-like isoform X2 [Alosa sapidissima]